MESEDHINGLQDGTAPNGSLSHRIELNKNIFSEEQVTQINNLLLKQDLLRPFIEGLNYKQLSNLLERLIPAAIAYRKEKFNEKLTEKKVRKGFENILDYKVRTNCDEDMTFCVQGGCVNINPKCAKLKIIEDILAVLKHFDFRRKRSSKPHIALELFLKGLVDNYNCIGVVLSDKLGVPKIITTDGSRLSKIISAGTSRLQEAIYHHEFKYSKASGPLNVFNQKFHIEKFKNTRLKAVEENPGLLKFLKTLTFASLGFDVAFDRMILSLIYLGDNLMKEILPGCIEGITRIRIETDPEAKFRFELEATIKE